MMRGKDYCVFLAAVLLFWLVVVVAIASAVAIIGHAVGSLF